MQGKELNFTKVGYPIHDWSVRKSGEKLGKNVSKFNIQSKIITISFKGLYKRGPLFTVFLKWFLSCLPFCTRILLSLSS